MQTRWLRGNLVHAPATIIALALAAAAAVKILALGDFARVTSTFTWMPWSMRRWLPLGVPAVEIAVAWMVAIPPFRLAGLWLAAVLFIGFSIVLLFLVANPYAPPCNCFGLLSLASDARTANELALARNVVFLTVCGIALRVVYTERRRSIVAPPALAVPASEPVPAAGRAPSVGFTLIELLVSVGIIAALMGVLIPAIAGVRAQAARTQCASRQREVVGMILARASENGGFAPLAGTLHVTPRTAGLGSLPAALNDSHRRRYLYLPDRHGSPTVYTPTFEQVAPWPLAVAMAHRGMGLNVSLEHTESWAQLRDLHRELRAFECPAAAAARSASADRGENAVLLVIGPIGYGTLWRTQCDFAVNGGLLGFHHEWPLSPRRLRGHLAGVRASSRVVLLGDGLCHEPSSDTPSWTPSVGPGTGDGPVTLRDVLERSHRVERSVRMDPVRHGLWANLTFVDGHVETVRLTAQQLERALLSER